MMTSKERWIAAIKMQQLDRLPFWPKLDCAYIEQQSELFNKMSLDEIHNWIGSDRHNWISSCIKEVRQNTSSEIIENGYDKKTIFNTKYGTIESIDKFDPATKTWHPIKYPIESLNDINIMIEWFSDCKFELDYQKLSESILEVKRIGNDSIIATVIGISPLMQYIQYLAGIENGHYFLNDYNDEIEELFSVMHKNLISKTKIISENVPADIFYFIENTSTTLISPVQYKKYCFKHISQYGDILKSEGKYMVVHMCGLLKDLLPDLSKLPVAAFEAFTSPTVGNTTLLDGRNACSDKCLIGGTNAILWTKTSDEIIAKLKQDLDDLPHNRGIVVTSAGVMPPSCKPETIKKVCEWVKSYRFRY